MATDDDSDIPESGAVFTFGKSKFADNAPSKFWIRNDRVLHVACGDEHTAFIAESGRIFTFGANDWGQLGLGHNKVVTKPSCIKSLKSEKITTLGCGRSHTLVASANGLVFTFGANGEGQLGTGDTVDYNTPQHVDTLPETIYSTLTGGTDHSMALSESGDVFVWGGGSEGQLGLGRDELEAPNPRRLDVGEKVQSISCGYYHSALVSVSGVLYTFGETDGGKLGHGEKSLDHSIPQPVESISEKVRSVACGGSHTVAVTDSGKLYSFGDSSNGQLGQGTTMLELSAPELVSPLRDVKVSEVSCGENHTAVISDRGYLYTFGDGRHGKLGLGEENFANQFRPSKVIRFAKFSVEKVCCGGCHMLVLAKLKLTNGEIESDEDVDEEIHPKSARDSLMVSESIDLSGSYSARDRRRQKPDLQGTLNRTLPPLNSTLPGKSLPPLNSTIATPEKVNPLNRGKLPMIKTDDEPAVANGIIEKEQNMTEGSESEGKSETKMTPMPKPRGALKSPEQSKAPADDSPGDEDADDDDDDAGNDASEEEEDSGLDDDRPQAAPRKGKAVTIEDSKDEEDQLKDVSKETAEELVKKEAEDAVNEDKEDAKKKKKEEKEKKKKRKVGIFGRKKHIESEEEDEDEDEDDDGDEKEQEEEDDKDKANIEDKKSKDKKDKDKKGKDKKGKDKKDKDKKDKKEKDKEKDKKDKKKKDKKKGKKDKDEEDADETEEDGDEDAEDDDEDDDGEAEEKDKKNKDKDTKNKIKEEKDKKDKDKKDKDKDKKDKDKDKKDKDKDKKDKDKETKDKEENSKDTKKDEDKKDKSTEDKDTADKNDEGAAGGDKDKKDDKPAEPAKDEKKPEQKKKSRTCTLL